MGSKTRFKYPDGMAASTKTSLTSGMKFILNSAGSAGRPKLEGAIQEEVERMVTTAFLAGLQAGR